MLDMCFALLPLLGPWEGYSDQTEMFSEVSTVVASSQKQFEIYNIPQITNVIPSKPKRQSHSHHDILRQVQSHQLRIPVQLTNPSHLNTSSTDSPRRNKQQSWLYQENGTILCRRNCIGSLEAATPTTEHYVIQLTNTVLQVCQCSLFA